MLTTPGARSYKTPQDEAYESLRRADLKDIDPCLIADNFARFARRQDITRFLARVELFNLVRNVAGCIIEGGVYRGQGLMTWAQLSSIHEPVGGAIGRHVYGFDTFDGFPSVAAEDGALWQKGDICGDTYEEIKRSIDLFDMNRHMRQFPKVTLIKGDVTKTAPAFIEHNPHLICSLLYLDFDIYAPTDAMLQQILPRMPKGAVIAFDEVNHPAWPGETLAMLKHFDLRQHALRKFDYELTISYIVL